MIALKLKVFMARRDGKEVVLTTEEAESILNKIEKMDQELAKLFGLLSPEAKDQVTRETFN